MGVASQAIIDAVVRGEVPEGYAFNGDLEIAHRPDLRRLPRGLTVRWLTLDDCPSIEELPDGLTAEWHVYVKGCPRLRRVGRGVRVGLNLDLSDCAAVDELPGDLRVGGNLYVGPGIRSLVAGLDLKCLNLRSALALRAAPAGLYAEALFLPAHVEEIGEDVEVDKLAADEGSLLRAIPESARIKSYLELPRARRIEALPPLRDMYRVDLPGSSLRAVSEVHARGWIDLTGCEALTTLDGPVTTETLRIQGCTRLERLENVAVETLYAAGCSALRRIPASVRVAALADLYGCTALEAIELEAPPRDLLVLAGAAQLDLLAAPLRRCAAVPVPGRGAPLGEPRILPVKKAKHMAFASPSARLATLTEEELVVWEASGERVGSVTPPSTPRQVAMAPGGEIVAIGAGFHHCRGGRDFCLWDLRRGDVVSLGQLAERPLLEVHRVGFSPDGRLAAAQDRSGRVLVVDVATRSLVEEPKDWPFAPSSPHRQSSVLRDSAARRLGDGRELTTLGGRVFLLDPSGERPHVFAVVSPDGGSVDVCLAERAGVIAACTRDGAVRVLDLRTLAPLAEGQAPEGWGIAVTEDGSVLAVATSEDVRIYRR